MYGVDINKLADTGVLEQDAPGQPQPALAEAKPQETQPQPSPQAQPAPQPEAQIAQKGVKKPGGRNSAANDRTNSCGYFGSTDCNRETKPATVAPSRKPIAIFHLLLCRQRCSTSAASVNNSPQIPTFNKTPYPPPEICFALAKNFGASKTRKIRMKVFFQSLNQ